MLLIDQSFAFFSVLIFQQSQVIYNVAIIFKNVFEHQNLFEFDLFLTNSYFV